VELKLCPFDLFLIFVEFFPLTGKGHIQYRPCLASDRRLLLQLGGKDAMDTPNRLEDD
jgi:hypothetical protein